MGKLKYAFMEIMEDDMGGGSHLDKKLVEKMLQDDKIDFEIAQTLHCIDSDVAHLNTLRGDLTPQKEYIDEIIAKLTKIAEKI